MARDFDRTMRDLSDRVGEGVITARVEVDQVYAKYQHERTDLRHPGGGKANYLRDPLFSRHQADLRRVARTILEFGPIPGMTDAAESVSQGVYEQAPFEFGDLKASPHPTVMDGSTLAYDRPPAVHRLSGDELRIKAELRRLGLGNQ